MSAETTTTLSVLLESSSLAIDTDSDIDYPASVWWETAVLDAWEDSRIYCICMWSCIYKSNNCLDSYKKLRTHSLLLLVSHKIRKIKFLTEAVG